MKANSTATVWVWVTVPASAWWKGRLALILLMQDQIPSDAMSDR